MGQRINVEQSTISKYETNNQDINLHFLQRLVDEFNIDPSEFIVTNNKNIHFENGSMVNGNGVVSENYYAVPKEMIDSIVTSQKHMTKLMEIIVERLILNSGTN